MEQRMKKTLLAISCAAVALTATTTRADDKRHVYVNVGSPHYRAAPPAYFHAPRQHYYHHNAYYRDHSHRHGRWRDGRWIAPVVVGATIGALAMSASTPVYSAPAPTYYDASTHDYALSDRFSRADVNHDGYLSYHESRRYGGLHRNFGAIDWNGDGYLSRDEVNAWRYAW
jgi:hypothetical protein